MNTFSAFSLAIAAAVGVCSGSHAAIWGMYKDAAHEGFDVARFSRSMIVGAIVAVALIVVLRVALPDAAALAIPGAGALVLLFGLAYAAERGVVEVWKTFVRDEDQAKYTIPMQFSIMGSPVKDRGTRLAAGLCYVVLVSLFLFAIAQLDASGPLRLWKSALVGLGVGMIIAVGGGWKDAPTEGFDLLKFFRSPAMTVAFSLLLSHLTGSYLEVAVAAIGYERATAETYKTFFFPSKPRGKFAGKPVLYPEMLERRIYFVPAYVAIWAAVLVSVGVAI